MPPRTQIIIDQDPPNYDPPFIIELKPENDPDNPYNGKVVASKVDLMFTQRLNLNISFTDQLKFQPFIAVGIGYGKYVEEYSHGDYEMGGYQLETSFGANLNLSKRFFLFAKYSEIKMRLTDEKDDRVKTPSSELKKDKLTYHFKTTLIGVGLSF